MEFDVSSATVELAALAVGVEGAEYARRCLSKTEKTGVSLFRLPETPRSITGSSRINSLRKPRCFLPKRLYNLLAMP